MNSRTRKLFPLSQEFSLGLPSESRELRGGEEKESGRESIKEDIKLRHKSSTKSMNGEDSPSQKSGQFDMKIPEDSQSKNSSMHYSPDLSDEENERRNRIAGDKDLTTIVGVAPRGRIKLYSPDDASNEHTNPIRQKLPNPFVVSDGKTIHKPIIIAPIPELSMTDPKPSTTGNLSNNDKKDIPLPVPFDSNPTSQLKPAPNQQVGPGGRRNSNRNPEAISHTMIVNSATGQRDTGVMRVDSLDNRTREKIDQKKSTLVGFGLFQAASLQPNQRRGDEIPSLKSSDQTLAPPRSNFAQLIAKKIGTQSITKVKRQDKATEQRTTY